MTQVYDHLPAPGGSWICGHKFETHGSVYEADRCHVRSLVPKDHALMRESLAEMADTKGSKPEVLRERVDALCKELGTVYREYDELLALTERLIRQERLASANLTEAQRASNRDQQAARDLRAEIRELNERLVSLQSDTFHVKMPRWVCPKCRTFNGEARMILRQCRFCGSARPSTSEP
jgi:rubrerythrin